MYDDRRGMTSMMDMIIMMMMMYRRGMTSMDMMMDPDAMDMPLTPASFAGLDHKDLEERPLTSLTNRMGKATVYDDPPEK